MKSIEKKKIVGDGTWAALIPFILITSCFALWGFANDITNPMVKAFSKIFRMSVTEGALVQVAFYGGILPWPSRRRYLFVSILIRLVS